MAHKKSHLWIIPPVYLAAGLKQIGLALAKLICLVIPFAILLHFSYRIYSIMLSSLIAGSVLALLFKPRTWRAVCPVNTLSDGYLKKRKKPE